MNKQELTARIDDSLPVGYPEGQKLTKEKVENRAINIQETDLYILFDIERHPGSNNPRHGQPDTTIQTWRYDKGTSALERVWEFAKSHRDMLEQNNVGEPVCRHCGTDLDLDEDVFGFIWRCTDCNAVGGKEEEIFNPTWGESPVNRSDYKEEDGLWVPVGTNGS